MCKSSRLHKVLKTKKISGLLRSSWCLSPGEGLGNGEKGTLAQMLFRRLDIGTTGELTEKDFRGLASPASGEKFLTEAEISDLMLECGHYCQGGGSTRTRAGLLRTIISPNHSSMTLGVFEDLLFAKIGDECSEDAGGDARTTTTGTRTLDFGGGTETSSVYTGPLQRGPLLVDDIGE